VRKKLVVAAAAGALTLTGLAVAVPAVADTEDTDGTSTSVVDRIKDALSGLVDDGSITQEQADEVATTLDGAGFGHHGGWFGLETAAETLGMTEDELRTALDAEGATLASIAEDKGVAVDTLVDALVKAKQEGIAKAVEEGMPQDVADERLADLQERVTEWVNATHEDMPWGGRGWWWGHHDD
jgi:lambda repressor-like predicted transcriptional regulator